MVSTRGAVIVVRAALFPNAEAGMLVMAGSVIVINPVLKKE
jgi:hypothetical protein